MKIKLKRYGSKEPVEQKCEYGGFDFHKPPTKRGGYFFAEGCEELALWAWKRPKGLDCTPWEMEYEGNIWHHLTNVPEDSIQERKGSWVKTSTEVFFHALADDICRVTIEMRGRNKDIPAVIEMSNDHREVYLEEW